MMITKKAIPRRTVLRGLGITVALPLLDSMVPAATALAQTPAAPTSRFGFVYVPHGSIMREWTPAQEGAELRVLADPQAAGIVPEARHGVVQPLELR